MKIIPATEEMIIDACGSSKTVRALAVINNDKVVGIGGIYYERDSQVVFSKISEELKNHPRWILKTWSTLVKMIDEKNIPTFAVCDFSIPKAVNMLLHLGFEPYSGKVWIRRK